MKALIVDDDPVNRKLLKAILQKEGYQPILAENGAEAISTFEREQADIILMDIMMPVMNGYDAARKIKEMSRDRFVPIIFLTAVTDEEALSRCVESGGDDFLTKPYNRIILRAKISAMERIRGLYGTLNEQKQELELYRSNIQHELEFAEHIFQNITSKGSLDLPYLSIWTSSMSMSMFNGDLVLAARKPSGGIHLLLCDFTGHGLPAAVGALPVSEVFVAMTERGFTLGDIILETNRKLRTELPTGFFCAAGMVDVDSTQGTLSVWNGGLPDIMVTGLGGGETRRIASNHLPLGITEKVINSGDIAVMEIQPETRIFMYTDGVIEAVNPAGEMFGEERLDRCFNEAEHPDEILERLQTEVSAFRQDADQHDDISFVQLNCLDALRDIPVEIQSSGPQGIVPAEWKVSFDLSAGILRDINPVPVILNVLSQIRLPSDHRKKIFTVLSELYTNALDHGLLELSSSMKSTPEGFANYYVEREKRLSGLKEGSATIEIAQVAQEDGYVLKIRVRDSGKGFEPDGRPKHVETLLETPVPSGRGIDLIRSLCESLQYFNSGSMAEAVYYLGKNQ